MLIDRFGRQITYLRVSVTDRCNLRCVYCMPPHGVPWQPHESILRYEEIVDVIRVAAKEGIREVRLTGGEPLVRARLPDLIRMIADIPGIEDIALTTNGILLEELARPLVEAGLKRINISLDTLKPEKFTRITRGGSIDRVWRGLRAAEENGLLPIKLNIVAMRGLNDDELVDLALLSMDHAWHIRFIELMPIANQDPWGEGFPDSEKAYFSVDEMVSVLAPLGMVSIEKTIGNGPAREFRLPGSKGTIGFISPLGDSFCDQCNRLRLTADGFFRPCLLSDVEIPIRQAIRTGDAILPLLMAAVALKPEGHELALEHYPKRRCMKEIGG